MENERLEILFAKMMIKQIKIKKLKNKIILIEFTLKCRYNNIGGAKYVDRISI